MAKQSKALRVTTFGDNGLAIKGHFEVEGFGRFDCEAHYSKLDEKMRDQIADAFAPEVEKFNAAPEITVELFSELLHFLDALSPKIVASMNPSG